jgi:Fe-S cluster assembly iron-binding protein IscA
VRKVKHRVAGVTLAPGAAYAIKSFLSEKGVRGALRIELTSTGCCDASLGLSVDTVRESDLVEEVDGLTFLISPETQELVGEVMISYVDDAEREGFVLTSTRPVSEWDGFATTAITLHGAGQTAPEAC